MLAEFTLIEHLSEIRKRIIMVIICFIIIFVGVYIKTDQIINFILDLMEDVAFIYTKPEELLMSYIKVDILTALLLTIPIIAFQCWKFIKPALKENEKRICLFFFVIAIIFFFTGVAFSLFVSTPLCLYFLSKFTHYRVTPLLSLESYLSFIVNTTFIMGIIFDIPAIIFFLSSMKIVHYSTLKRCGKYVALILLIVAAVMTPPDVISQLMLFFPLFMLYELSLFICYVLEKKRWKLKSKNL